MNISVLIPWKSTDEHRENIFTWILDRYRRLLPELQICIGTNVDSPFNRSAARNDAFSKAKHMNLLVADADTILQVGAIIEAYDRLLENRKQWFVLYGDQDYYNLRQKETQEILSGRSDARIYAPTQWDHKLKSTAGGILVPREAWNTVGGYDQKFRGWGGEDNAFQLILDTLWSPYKRIQGFAAHLWHERGVGDFTNPEWPYNKKLLDEYIRASKNPIRMKKYLHERSS